MKSFLPQGKHSEDPKQHNQNHKKDGICDLNNTFGFNSDSYLVFSSYTFKI